MNSFRKVSITTGIMAFMLFLPMILKNDFSVAYFGYFVSGVVAANISRDITN